MSPPFPLEVLPNINISLGNLLTSIIPKGTCHMPQCPGPTFGPPVSAGFPQAMPAVYSKSSLQAARLRADNIPFPTPLVASPSLSRP